MKFFSYWSSCFMLVAWRFYCTTQITSLARCHLCFHVCIQFWIFFKLVNISLQMRLLKYVIHCQQWNAWFLHSDHQCEFSWFPVYSNLIFLHQSIKSNWNLYSLAAWRDLLNRPMHHGKYSFSKDMDMLLTAQDLKA